MSRSLLHKDKLQDFKAWVEAHPNLEWRDTAGMGDGYCVAQVRSRSGGWDNHWLGIYERLRMPEHFTVDSRLEATVHHFIRQTRVRREAAC